MKGQNIKFNIICVESENSESAKLKNEDKVLRMTIKFLVTPLMYLGMKES